MTKFAICCCWVCRKAVRNFSYCSSDVNTSSNAAVRLYTVLSLQTSANSGRVRTPRLSSSSSKPKSGSTMFVRADFSLTMFSKILGTSSTNITSHTRVCRKEQILHVSRLKWHKQHKNDNKTVFNGDKPIDCYRLHAPLPFVITELNNSCSIKHRAVKYEWSMGFPTTADRMVRPPTLPRDRKLTRIFLVSFIYGTNSPLIFPSVVRHSLLTFIYHYRWLLFHAACVTSYPWGSCARFSSV